MLRAGRGGLRKGDRRGLRLQGWGIHIILLCCMCKRGYKAEVFIHIILSYCICIRGYKAEIFFYDTFMLYLLYLSIFVFIFVFFMKNHQEGEPGCHSWQVEGCLLEPGEDKKKWEKRFYDPRREKQKRQCLFFQLYL